MQGKKYIILYIFSVQLVIAEFREITPLENTTIKKEEVRDRKNNIKMEAQNFNKKKEEVLSEVNYVQNSEELQKVIEKNSVPVITEEKLSEIIENSKKTPLPDNDVENEEKFLSLELDKKSEPTPDFLVDLKDKLKKYNFSDKSEVLYGGQVNSKELINDKMVDNLEFGVGIAYKKREYYEREYEKKELDMWNHTPIYATGKYRVNNDENIEKYLKVNLGYAIGEYENETEYDEVKAQNGFYYGVGGGVEYEDITLDLMYQVNKDAYNKNNSSEDNARVTFSVDYKLDL